MGSDVGKFGDIQMYTMASDRLMDSATKYEKDPHSKEKGMGVGWGGGGGKRMEKEGGREGGEEEDRGWKEESAG